MTQSSTPRRSLPDILANSNPTADQDGYPARIGFVDQTTGEAVVPSQDIAAYIADMVGELRVMAQQTGFETLSRILEIAEREAKWRAQVRP